MNLLVKSPVWDYLRETGLRIAAENPGAADRFLTVARESFEFLRRHPRIGRLRSFSVPKTILSGFDGASVFFAQCVEAGG